MATHGYLLRAAYLLNDVGATHHEHGQYDEAMESYSQSLRLRGEAIDAAVARAQEEASGGPARSEEELEAYCDQLAKFVLAADAQGPGAEAVRIRAEDEARQDPTATHGEGKESSTKLFRLPLRIFSSTQQSVQAPVWSTAAAEGAPPGEDSSSVTLHNMSLVHLRNGNLDCALQLSEMAHDGLEGIDTDLCRAVVLSNRAWMLECRQQREAAERGAIVAADSDNDDDRVANEIFEEAIKFSLRSDQEGSVEAGEIAADIMLNGACVFLRDSEVEDRIDDALELCSHVCQGFPLDSRTIAPSMSSSSHIKRRAHVLLALALRAAGTRLYLSGGFGEADHLLAAQRPLARALYLQSTLLGESHPAAARTAYLLGRVLHDREEYGDAGGMYERAMTVQRDAVLHIMASPSSHDNGKSTKATDLLNTMTNLAKVYLVRGALSQALSVCTDTLELSRAFLHAEQERGDLSHQLQELIVVLLHMMGSICQEMGRAADAVGCFVDAVRTVRLRMSNGEQVQLPPLVDMRTIQGCNAIQDAAAAA
eukprot:CAMPEP_0113553584 /NCGR_PEP_ID=MMETSP0015_2-20120614/15694_1 /TAXON_ID=2838 /ORGANISM="Odontella" /LENGTH=537 /DNA_ID=CAMNT_0000454669 /DNA_START=28 /DNA_END=1641 /DNA_ORIENTATION=+ /assembly_acc=CAM_ASM_000160